MGRILNAEQDKRMVYAPVNVHRIYHILPEAPIQIIEQDIFHDTLPTFGSSVAINTRNWSYHSHTNGGWRSNTSGIKHILRPEMGDSINAGYSTESDYGIITSLTSLNHGIALFLTASGKDMNIPRTFNSFKISCYIGHNDLIRTSAFIIEIEGVRYVNTVKYTTPVVVPNDSDFTAMAVKIEQTLNFADSGHWDNLAFIGDTILERQTPVAGALPAGNITGIGLLHERTSTSSTAIRASNFKITIT